jgi:hypothetical protein
VQRRPASAARLLARGLEKLEACAADAGGLELEGFRGAVRASVAAVEQGALRPAQVPRLTQR